MGLFLGDDDMYIEGLLEDLNLRFGFFPDARDEGSAKFKPAERAMRLNASGISEIHAIQAEFELFKAGRPLVQSLRALGVGGLWNSDVKRKWFKLLSNLDWTPSSEPDVSGGDAIVAALVEDLARPRPDPVHFKAHDARQQRQVVILKKDRPIFYLDMNFVTVSLPMAPRMKVPTVPAESKPAPRTRAAPAKARKR